MSRVNTNNKYDNLDEHEAEREDFNKIINNPVGKEPIKNLCRKFWKIIAIFSEDGTV